MKKLIFSVIILCIYFIPSKAQLSIDVTNLGAVADGSTDNTFIIQQAIDSCTNNGGGEVVFTGGEFYTNTIRLKSNVTLRINSGANLLAPNNNDAYPDIPYDSASWSDTYTQKSLIFAEGADNIRITGGGKIKFNGQAFAFIPVSQKERAFGLRINHCTNIKIDSIRLENAPHWMVHIARSQHIHIHHTEIYNQCFGANDGIDIDCCQDVLIEDCDIDSNDDPIVIKSHSEDLTRDVLVRNCTVATFERAIKVGNESLGPFKNIRFEDITIKASTFPLPALPQTAIYLAIADGGSADSIFFERINILTPYQTPIFIRLCNRGLDYNTGAPPKPVQYLQNVVIRDVVATAGSTIPVSITGIPNYKVENILMQNIAITVPGGGAINSQPIEEKETERPENDIWGETLPAYGAYVRHAYGVTFDNYCITLAAPDPRPKYVMEDTTAIVVMNDTCQSSLGFQIIEPAKPYVFPNPSNLPSFSIKNLSQEFMNFSVKDIAGRIIYENDRKVKEEILTVYLKNASYGLYLLEIQTPKGSTFAKWIYE